VPPSPRGFEWLRVVGPGVLVLGLSIGSGEFLLGPAVFVRYGLSLLWVTVIAVILQAIFNMELMRYTLATGEPIFTGFMRTRPSSTLWALVYALLYFLQHGWTAFAATAAGAVYFLIQRRLPGPADSDTIYVIGAILFLGCAVILSFGRRIVRTLEILNWVLVVTTLGAFLLMTAVFVPGETMVAGITALVGYDTTRGQFDLFPADADLVLLGALVAYSGAGGVSNLVLSNWARDKGYGMSQMVGYISGAIGGNKVALAHSGFTFAPSDESMRRWGGWWRIIGVDQWGIFALGAVLGMMLPAMIYVALLPPGMDIQGLGISAALAAAVGNRAGPLLAGAVAFLGAWILFKTQLDNLEGMVRAITDILWTGSARLRAWRNGDVRRVYYTVMAIVVLWGITALRLAQPIILLKISANVAGAVLIVASLHVLYVNTHLLPEHVRPPLWRRAALVAMALFYGFFVVLSVGSLW
jgi:Mn2+/Fe2+ NRAMP family transporter